MRKLHITKHALDRYAQRVDGAATTTTARRVIEEVAQTGRARPVPRRWMRTVRPAPGLAFIYSATHPGICLAVKDRTIVTVYSRSTCKSWLKAAAVSEQAGRSGRGRSRARSRPRADLAPSRLAA